jgi:hypothetical protein
MLTTPEGKVSWPQWNIQKPSLFADKSTAEPPKNTWVEPPAQPKPSPFQPIKDGAHKFSASTKNAWSKTVAAVKGEPKETTPAARNGGARVAKRDTDPPFWKKMFGAKPETQGPQTVPEWMAQQRLDP